VKSCRRWRLLDPTLVSFRICPAFVTFNNVTTCSFYSLESCQSERKKARDDRSILLFADLLTRYINILFPMQCSRPCHVQHWLCHHDSWSPKIVFQTVCWFSFGLVWVVSPSKRSKYIKSPSILMWIDCSMYIKWIMIPFLCSSDWQRCGPSSASIFLLILVVVI